MNQSLEEIAENLIIKYEGIRLKPYEDSLGNLTIGIGRNLSERGISRAEAFALLRNDLRWVKEELEKYDFYKALNPVRKAVLINMMFNLGPERFSSFKKMISALEIGDFRSASVEMLRSKWAVQVGVRAIELAKLMLTGEMKNENEIL